MKITEIETFFNETIPCNSRIWQIEFIPGITLFKGDFPQDSYISLTFSWLFWSFTITIYYN